MPTRAQCAAPSCWTITSASKPRTAKDGCTLTAMTTKRIQRIDGMRQINLTVGLCPAHFKVPLCQRPFFIDLHVELDFAWMLPTAENRLKGFIC